MLACGSVLSVTAGSGCGACGGRDEYTRRVDFCNTCDLRLCFGMNPLLAGMESGSELGNWIGSA